jgi:RNA polymerase sigma factor (sigma-70 family)
MPRPLDGADITRLYDRHAEAMLAFFVRRTYASDVAVDLVAETFAVAFRDRRQFRGTGAEAARAWLFAIARHQLADYFRRGEVERRALAQLGVDRRPLTDAEYDRIEELAASEELRGHVAVALAGLPEDQREVLRLRVVEERSYRELARTLDISEQTARARVSRALRALRAASALAEPRKAPDHA